MSTFPVFTLPRSSRPSPLPSPPAAGIQEEVSRGVVSKGGLYPIHERDAPRVRDVQETWTYVREGPRGDAVRTQGRWIRTHLSRLQKSVAEVTASLSPDPWFRQGRDGSVGMSGSSQNQPTPKARRRRGGLGPREVDQTGVLEWLTLLGKGPLKGEGWG